MLARECRNVMGKRLVGLCVSGATAIYRVLLLHYRACMSCTCPIESTPACSAGPCIVGSAYMPGWWAMWPPCAIIIAGCGCPGSNMACEGSGGPRRWPYDATAGDVPYRSDADKSCIPAINSHQSFITAASTTSVPSLSNKCWCWFNCKC